MPRFGPIARVMRENKRGLHGGKIIFSELDERNSHFGLAFNLACPFCSSTVYSTALQPYSFCNWVVFCFTNFLNESRLAGLFSPAFLRASVSAWKRDSTCFWSAFTSEKEVLNG